MSWFQFKVHGGSRDIFSTQGGCGVKIGSKLVHVVVVSSFREVFSKSATNFQGQDLKINTHISFDLNNLDELQTKFFQDYIK